MSATPPLWTFILTDLQGNVISEIVNADERQVTLPLNRLATAAFKVPLAHPLANTMLSMTNDTMVKAYRWDGINPKKLAFFGPVLSAEEVADRDNQSVAVSAVSPYWRVTKRLLGIDKAGISFGIPDLLEINQIAANVFDSVNNGVPGSPNYTGREYTGINLGTVTYNTPNNMTRVGPFRLKPAGELIAELSASVNAFDFEVEPIEPAAGAFWVPQFGKLNIVPYIGTTKPDLIFEYGGQANVVGYNRSQSREGYMNRGYIVPSSYGDGNSAELYVKTDDTSIQLRGLYEDSMPDGEVTDVGVRDAILSEHLYHRAHPRELINVTLAQNARPWGFTDWIVGDTVRARAQVGASTRFDAMFRIWGATFSVDKNGNETTQLELVMP